MKSTSIKVVTGSSKAFSPMQIRAMVEKAEGEILVLAAEERKKSATLAESMKKQRRIDHEKKLRELISKKATDAQCQAIYAAITYHSSSALSAEALLGAAPKVPAPSVVASYVPRSERGHGRRNHIKHDPSHPVARLLKQFEYDLIMQGAEKAESVMHEFSLAVKKLSVSNRKETLESIDD